jgi:hypothetical protein
MASKNKVTVSVQPTTRRPTTAERRAAQLAALSTHQAKLKHEAAERRRTRNADPAAASPRGLGRQAPHRPLIRIRSAVQVAQRELRARWLRWRVAISVVGAAAVSGARSRADRTRRPVHSCSAFCFRSGSCHWRSCFKACRSWAARKPGTCARGPPVRLSRAVCSTGLPGSAICLASSTGLSALQPASCPCGARLRREALASLPCSRPRSRSSG